MQNLASEWTDTFREDGALLSWQHKVINKCCQVWSIILQFFDAADGVLLSLLKVSVILNIIGLWNVKGVF